ncbi:MAG: hybrid sensor histidine kinase/response regulator [Desulfobacterales bacterium]
MEPKKTSSVIVIDDNTNNLHVLAGILRNKGLKVATVRNGFKALKFIRHKKPDLILLDIMMPEMDGYEVCKRLKADPDTVDIPIIFITALNDMEDKIKGFEHGCVDYIAKPFRREEVFARVIVHLNLRQAQEELKIANKRLQIANSTKDKLFSIIAHDLRGPISSLSGMLEMVTTNPDILYDINRLDVFNEMKSSAQNVYHLLENLLSWTINQQGNLDCHPKKFHLKPLLKNIINLFSSAARQKNISIHSTVSDNIMVFADTDMIMTVLRNLISNSLKFTDDSGQITISAKLDAVFVEIAVNDTGIGISENHLHKLFFSEEMFSTYGTRNEKGSGLGLLLCKEFIEKNGGSLKIESRLEQGSRFIFTLPAPIEH